MFIVKTAPSPSDETLVGVRAQPDRSARKADRLARRRRPAALEAVERSNAPLRPVAGGHSPSEDASLGEPEAA